MLAIGVAVGAAIGPAPTASFAGSAELPLLLHSLIGSASTTKTAPAASQPAASAETATPTWHRHRKRAIVAAASEEAATPAATEEGSGSSTKSKGSGECKSTKALPPVTRVWVVQLNGAGFEEALASPSAAPYIDSQAIPSGRVPEQLVLARRPDLRQRRGADRHDGTAGRAEHHPAPVP